MKRGHTWTIGTVLVCVLAPAAAGASTIAIDHTPASCALAGKFVRLEAHLSPADAVGRARLHFRGDGPHWYSVDMSPEGDVFVAVLPKPLGDLGSVRYYVEVTDHASVETYGPEYRLAVVPEPGECGVGKTVAAAVGQATIRVSLPPKAEGAPPVPPGFAPDGIEGAPVQAAAARPKAPAGGHRQTYIAAGAAGVAAVALAASSGGGSGSGAGSGSAKDLTGRWTDGGTGGFVFHETNGSSSNPVECEEDAEANAVLNLTQSGSDLTGDMTWTLRKVTAGSRHPACDDVGDQFAFTITGTLTGTAASGSVQIQAQRAGVLRPAILLGTVTPGRMSGPFSLQNRQYILNGTWSLVRQ